MQRGVLLEQLVSEELTDLNVVHEMTGGTEFDQREKVDILVDPCDGRPPLEFQLTLREGFIDKMRRFVEAALRNLDRGPRVYLEVHCSWGRNLREVARRVAWAIKDIVRNFRNFDVADLLGIRLRAGRPKRNPRLERFPLLKAVGLSWLRNLVDRIIHDQAEQERVAKLERVREQRRRTPWWRDASVTQDPSWHANAPAPANKTFLRRRQTPLRLP